MQGNPKVADGLNWALHSDRTAVSQFRLHARLHEDGGLSRLARKNRADSIGEMRPADRLIAGVAFLGGHPNRQELDALGFGETPGEGARRLPAGRRFCPDAAVSAVADRRGRPH